MAMTEETLVQEVTADYLLSELHWDESLRLSTSSGNC